MHSEGDNMRYKPKNEKEIMCPLEYGLDIFGGKWKSRIICVLSANDTMRYNEIKKELSNITDGVLAEMLKELVADGIVNREQYLEVPTRVEYNLTEKGNSVLTILQNICQWSRDNTEENLGKKLPPCKTCNQL